MKQEIINTYLYLKEHHGRSASRMFAAKKNNHLKEELFRLTSFLDEKDFLSKRIYCLIHNITEKPRCECGTLIKTWDWNKGFRKECKYCMTQNPNRAKKMAVTCLKRFGVTTNLQTEEVNKKRLETQKSDNFSKSLKKMWSKKTKEDIKQRQKKIRKTSLERYGADNVFKKESSLFEKVHENSKKAIIEKYGVKNPSQLQWVKEKQVRTLIKNGHARHPDQKSYVELYYTKVWEVTNKAFKENYYELTENDTIKRGKEFHLDHIYSIHCGFMNNIPPYIIGHKNNLRLIPAAENTAKNKRCDITIDEIIQ